MNNKDKIVHLFQWDIPTIIDNLDQIKSSGWTSVLITPVQPSKEEDNPSWYMRYQITNLTIGNRYGSKEQLIELCQKVHKKGLKVYTDIIITHFGNVGGGDKQLEIHKDVDKNLVDNPYFWREKKCINYDDRYSITHHCNSLPAIRVDNYDYQDLVIEFINSLIDIGFDGVRLDSAKMISTPEEEFGESRNMFFKRVLESIKKPIYIFGEVIFEKKEIIEKYQKYIDVLTEFSGNSYNLNMEKTLFFIESHDTFNDEHMGYTRNWDMTKIVNEYAFLVRDFQKVLFYVRPNDNTYLSDKIKRINNTYK